MITTEPRRAAARYRSICPTCGRPIEPGSEIVTQPGGGARHFTCARNLFAAWRRQQVDEEFGITESRGR